MNYYELLYPDDQSCAMRRRYLLRNGWRCVRQSSGSEMWRSEGGAVAWPTDIACASQAFQEAVGRILRAGYEVALGRQEQGRWVQVERVRSPTGEYMPLLQAVQIVCRPSLRMRLRGRTVSVIVK